MPTADGGKPNRGPAFVGRVAWAVALCCLLLLTLSGFVSLEEKLMPGDIDSAWNLTLFWAHTHAVDFGHDLVFTFGPWGFIYHGFSPDATRWHLAGWSLIGIAFFAGVLQIGRKMSAHRWIRTLWMLAVVLVAGATVDLSQDMRLFSLAWLLLWLQFCQPREKMARTRLILLVALALASLIKFTVLLMALPILLVISVDELSQRRFPKVFPAFIVLLLIFWIGARQSITSLGPWLMHGWELSSGYAQAMEYSQGDRGDADIALFLAGAILFLASAAIGLWQSNAEIPRGRKFLKLMPPMVGLAAIVFVLFKEGFIRQDIHEMVAVNSLALLCLLAAGALWTSMSNWIGRPMMFLAIAANVAIASNSCDYWESKGWPRQIVGEIQAAGHWPAGAWSWAAGDQELRQRYELALQNMSTVDLPPIHGSVDVYPWASNLILARGLQYDPRPVFQSYSAYTPELAKMNADFLKGPRAPDTALINVESIEHRFAPQDDAASWPELLTGYDLIWASPSILVLQRSPQPRTFSLEPVKVLTVPMGTPVDVPQIADPVWVSVRVDLTPSGRITAALYRPPMIGMLVMPTSGGSVPFRLVPQTAREGFLLSPAVLRPRLFALLASTQWQQSMQNFMIRQIAVGGFDGADPQGLYEPNCTILFSALKFEHHDLSQVPGMSQFLAPQPSTER